MPIIYRSSRIESGIAAFTDSPDVPVTAASNTTQSENSVFVSPLNPFLLLNSNNSSNWPATQIFGSSYWISADGGLTWTGSTAGAGGSQLGDPAAAIDRNGRMFVGYVAQDYGQGVAYSDNNGASWTPRTIAPGPFVLDKGHMWVDDYAGSPFVNYLYAAWTNFQGGAADAQIEFMRSTDGGLNWTNRQPLSAAILAGSHNQGVNIQTGPSGDVYVVWAVYDSFPSDETALGFAKSTNGGLSFSPAQRIITGIRGHRITALGGEKTMRHNSFPSMAVDQQTGQIFVVWTNIGVPGVNAGDPDIYLISSSDDGATWSAPRRVNRDPQGNGKDNYFPWLSCDPVTGLLACVYYDSRNFAANDMVETYVATSTDDGVTWQDFRVSDVAWSGDGIVGFDGDYAGDYIGIAARDNHVYPMWCDDRTGNMLTYVSPFTAAPDTLPPIADFSGNPTSGPGPLTVQFTDLTAHGPTSWLWDFGDSSGSTLQNPAHIYTKAGSYTVSLTASNAYGSDTDTKVNYVTVTAPDTSRPVADFTGSPTSGLGPLPVQFTDLSTHTPTAWLWDFGDGGGSTLQKPAYTYTKAGSYTVSLTASNAYGSNTATKVKYVTVTPRPNIHVQSIAVTRVLQGAMWRADARVTIVDENRAPVAAATVTGVFNALSSRTKSGTTDATGVALIRWSKTKTPPPDWCFTVASVTKSGETYDPGQNVVTTGCESGSAEPAIAASGSGEMPFASAQDPAEPADIVTSSGSQIELRLDAPSHLRIEIFDVGGRRMATLVDGYVSAGEHGYTWNRRGAPNGVYFYRVQGPGLLKTGKILVLAH